MRVDSRSLMLYLVTDRSWLGSEKLTHQVERSLKNGVTFLQLREKNLPKEDFLSLAREIKELAKRYHVPFVINDNVEIAIESNVDGVHIGQDDMEVSKARQLIGEDKILGVSVGTVEEAIEAMRQGADYLGVGAMFTTDTKNDAKYVMIETLKAICDSVDIPVVAIGGIHKDNLMNLKGSNVDGIAVISAILAKKDIEQATIELKKSCEEMVRHD